MTKNEENNIVKNGVLVANMGSNWDLWQYGDMLYSIAKSGSGAGSSCWCPIARLRAHLCKLRRICKYDALIPPYWQNVNYDFLAIYGIQ
ncbi:hypothetical protein [Enterocloster bolteae]|uniref:hypothetical protein n=1 Tax=Enterocloster bolteae TaxID=208479 RepID=UPI00210E4D22|nr:hypothetical protein [Enterocloster bolteae]MCQ5143420.1 hypothetical protein [Enterocloster bolteae]